MKFLQRLLKKEPAIKVTDAASFWRWFALHEKTFFRVIQQKKEVDVQFLEKIMPKLQDCNGQFFCLAGMENEHTAELVITAEGDIKTFVFVEDLVAAAPVLPGWKFTALKQVAGLNTSVEMDGMVFNSSRIRFFYTQDEDYPDEIDISLVHADYNESDRKSIRTGTYIFLDNALGELNAAVLIDDIDITGPAAHHPELIPVDKLNNFLIWREKEFVEKYRGVRRNTANDNYAVMEARDHNGLFSIAVINQDLLSWDATASHPWMLAVIMKFNGSSNNGLPDKADYALMEQLEERLAAQLPDHAGYLNLGRDTYKGERTVYFACNEFRNVSRITAGIIRDYAGSLDTSYDIFKDKYWRVMTRFKTDTVV
jgi:hypothetical protein